MKILITLYVFSFSSLLFADDISDFEIEGMSIGDSLLEYYSISEIKNAPNYNYLPSDMKFTIIPKFISKLIKYIKKLQITLNIIYIISYF